MTTTPNPAAVGLLRDTAKRIVTEFRPEGWPAKEAEITCLLERTFSLAAERPRPEALPAEVEAALSAGSDVLWGRGTGTYDEAQHAIMLLVAALRRSALPPAGGAQLREAAEIIRNMVRLADMGLEESLREPEENGNFATYERAKRFLAALAAPEPGGVEAAKPGSDAWLKCSPNFHPGAIA